MVRGSANASVQRLQHSLLHKLQKIDDDTLFLTSGVFKPQCQQFLHRHSDTSVNSTEDLISLKINKMMC